MHESEIRICCGAFLDLFNISLIFHQQVTCLFCHRDFLLCQKNVTVEIMVLVRALYNPPQEGRGEGAHEILKIVLYQKSGGKNKPNNNNKNTNKTGPKKQITSVYALYCSSDEWVIVGSILLCEQSTLDSQVVCVLCSVNISIQYLWQHSLMFFYCWKNEDKWIDDTRLHSHFVWFLKS